LHNIIYHNVAVKYRKTEGKILNMRIKKLLNIVGNAKTVHGHDNCRQKAIKAWIMIVQLEKSPLKLLA